ncbi:MucBP domain-containing protein [Leucobacter sp. M11]|uniref:MucBP domain-containing protein n=1 Tax=Leucobacter sp. M11 TaxID=2993565 RepID=UPI002D7FFAFF|nr:MucBP domain-containing protein [Leucobacter sp. M11]MEB4616274.1 MucBP domain-containing protein [Leucobacter sp. M11]
MHQRSKPTWLAGGLSLALVAGVLGVSAPASAADATVANVGELQTAIQALPAGPSTITLASDFAPVGATPVITIPSGVQLTLTGDGTTVTKESGAPSFHLNLTGDRSQTVTITDLVFEGPNPADPSGQAGGIPGGGVMISDVATVAVERSTFSGADGASGLGLGGVSTLTVAQSSFLGNRAAYSAAIGLPAGITATITDSTLHKNWGTQEGFSGGAIRAVGKTALTVENSVFSGNVSNNRGGGIAFHQMDGELTVRDSLFTGNSVPFSEHQSSMHDGGAIAVSERPITGQQTGVTTISGTTFQGNTAADEGGALLIQSGNGSTASVTNSTFFDNRAQGLQTKYDDSSGGGAIEAFGTPLTLKHNTFVNNIAEKGNWLLGPQRGGAVSAVGDGNYLPAQPLVMSHNLLVGNDVLDGNGNSALNNSYRQISATAGVETPGGGDIHETNVGIDNGTRIDLDVINRLAVLGDDAAAPAQNASGIVAGDPRTGYAQNPGTFLFHPGDESFLTGLADGVGPAAEGVAVDQRGFPVDDPADAGALQQAFIRYDPNGGDWADYVAAPFDGQRIVQRPDAALVWSVGAIGSGVSTEPAPTTAPEGSTFVGWNTAADGSGTAYPAGEIIIPAGNLRLYAQWEDEEPPVTDGTVRVEYLDEAGTALRDAITLTGAIGDPYRTEQLTFSGYDFVRVEGETNGAFAAEPGTVRYHYEKQDAPPTETGRVVADYVDTAGAKIGDSITHTGTVGAAYQTKQQSFPGYSFVRVEGKPTGVFATEPIRVTYVYEADGAVTPPTEPPAGKTPPGDGQDPLAESGASVLWPTALAGLAALLLAGGIILFAGRRRAAE